MAKYNISINPANLGVCANVPHNGRVYFADLAYLPILGDTECMIFDITEEGQLCFSNANELYCKRGIPTTEDALTACIDEFLASLAE